MLYVLSVILTGWLLMAVSMTTAFMLRNRIRNTGVVDALWALGVGAMAVLYALSMNGHWLARCLLLLFAGIWSLRLGLHILVDRVLGKPEDGRYQDLLASWGDDAPRRLFRFFQMQALFAVIFSLPFIPIALAPAPPRLWQIILAFAIGCSAIGGEAAADAQLARWRANPENRAHTCRNGWWRYSRHPNYFFEWMHWWTYVVLWGAAQWGWITLLGPALMFFFLYRVTGIPYTEKQALKSRGEEYRAYQESVNAFFPWFPRKK